MINYSKLALSILLLVATCGFGRSETDDFILEEDGIIQIVCKVGNSPGAACRGNGEFANFFTDDGETSITYGNGVCLGCPTNQPADTVSCEADKDCSCVKCLTVECEEPQGRCGKASSSVAASLATTLAVVVLSIGGSLLL